MKQLVSEMHAEQVTTEVVDSELEDEDDASSSIDLRSGVGDSGSTFNEVLLILKNFLKFRMQKYPIAFLVVKKNWHSLPRNYVKCRYSIIMKDSKVNFS